MRDTFETAAGLAVLAGAAAVLWAGGVREWRDPTPPVMPFMVADVRTGPGGELQGVWVNEQLVETTVNGRSPSMEAELMHKE